MLKKLIELTKKIITAFLILYSYNIIVPTNIMIPINIITVIILTILGLPGLILLIIIKLMIY